MAAALKWKRLQKKINRGWQRRWWNGGRVKWKRLQKQSTGGGSGGGSMAAAQNGSGCKKNQLEVAAAVVAWRQRKMQHPAQAFLKNNKSF